MLLPSIVFVAPLIWVYKLLGNFALPVGALVGKKFDIATLWSASNVLLASSALWSQQFADGSD